MNTYISKDRLDGADCIIVNCVASENQLNHDRITELQALAHRYGLTAVCWGGATEIKQGEFQDEESIKIENPTVEFERALTLWLLK